MFMDFGLLDSAASLEGKDKRRTFSKMTLFHRVDLFPIDFLQAAASADSNLQVNSSLATLKSS